MKRYRYNLSHQTFTSAKLAVLMPFMSLEVAPGDTWSGTLSQLLRFQIPKFPYLNDLHMTTIVTYTPHRLVTDAWEKFVTDGPNPQGGTGNLPSVTVDDTVGSSFPNLRYYKTSGSTHVYSALRLGAYSLTFNEFFRDQERNPIASDYIGLQYETQGGINVSPLKDWQNTFQKNLVPTTSFTLDSSQPTIGAQEILAALAQQKAAMKRQTFGTRYVDVLRSYGINVNYQMLQRPEIVAVRQNTINVADVVGTNQDGTTSLGAYGGYAIGSGRVRIKRKSFPEHGTLLACAVVRPEYVHINRLEYHDLPTNFAGYYDPGLHNMPPVAVSPSDFKVNQSNTQMGYVPWGEWYRDAVSWQGNNFTGPLDTVMSADWYNDKVLRSNDYDEFFESNYPDTEPHYFQGATNNLSALRMIPHRAGVIAGQTG